MNEQTIGSRDRASLSIEPLLENTERGSFTGDSEGKVNY